MTNINKFIFILVVNIGIFCLLISPKILVAEDILQTNNVENKTTIESQHPYKCNAKPYKYLKGHMLSEVLSLKLPPNTRIYRFDDEAAQYDKTKNRLNIELDDMTFVRRVYCS